MHSDDRLPMAKAYQRATRGITVAVGMVVPGMLGHWLDSRWGTRAVFTIIGFGLGITYGILELARMSQPKQAAQPSDNLEQAATSTGGEQTLSDDDRSGIGANENSAKVD